MRLHLDEKKYILNTKHGILKKDGNEYYYKEILDDGVELVIEKLANMIDMKCVKHEVVDVDGRKFYFYCNKFQKDEFYTLNNLGFNSNVLTKLKEELASTLPNHYKYLIEQIIKIYLFDILVLNPSRENSDIGIYLKDKNITSVYMLENENCFYEKGKVRYIYDKSHNNKVEKINVREMPAIRKNMEELANFLLNEEDYYEIFNNMISVLRPEVIRNVWDEVEKELNMKIPRKEEYIRIYTLNYSAINENLIKNKLNR